MKSFFHVVSSTHFVSIVRSCFSSLRKLREISPFIQKFNEIVIIIFSRTEISYYTREECKLMVNRCLVMVSQPVNIIEETRNKKNIQRTHTSCNFVVYIIYAYDNNFTC